MKASMASRRKFLMRTGISLAAIGVGMGNGEVALAIEKCKLLDQSGLSAISPDQALQRLKQGNERFVAGDMWNCDYRQQEKITADGQHPFAAIVGCIDSRASNELVFDQGIGDVFSARVAGNFVNDDILGSLEFACAVTGAKLIVVLGHTECGAIKGACDDIILGNLTKTLANIKPAVGAVSGFDDDRSSKNAAFVQAAADKNVDLTMKKIFDRSEILKDLVDKGKIAVVGAMYDVHTGKVTFT